MRAGADVQDLLSDRVRVHPPPGVSLGSSHTLRGLETESSTITFPLFPRGITETHLKIIKGNKETEMQSFIGKAQ